MSTRPFEATQDRIALWSLKRAFERELGEESGDAETADAYVAKLSDAYRGRYLEWVERCVAEDERCVTVASGDDGRGLCGYAFVLPESLAMIWDAAVLNEFFVDPAYRGTGVADELMAAALAVARDQHLPLDRLVLDVNPENGRAVSFYERHGFCHWGEMVAREL